MRTRVFLSLMMLMSLFLAACGQEQITAENIVSHMRETQTNTNDMHAVVTLNYAAQDESGSVKGEFWMRKTGATDADGNPVTAVRAKILESSTAEMVGAEAVFNGESGWVYSPSDNTAIVGSRDDLKDMEQHQQSAGTTSQMDMMLQLQDLVQQGLDALDIEILGEETVAGHNAYKLKITPKQEMQNQLQLPVELLVETTLWVDSERWLPLKLLVDAKDMGRLEITAETLDTNTGLDQSLFEGQPPADATIKQLADVIAEMKDAAGSTEATTLDEAKAQAGFPVLTASDETAGAQLVDVQLMNLPQASAVIQSFSGPSIQWSLVQSKGDLPQGMRGNAGGKEVEVRGTKGTLVEGQGSGFLVLTWQENGVDIVLAGNITADQALKIAENLQ